ncbi:MAG: protein-disulfide reductase DsbD domain-containing protein [Phycisphaerales bacterium]
MHNPAAAFTPGQPQSDPEQGRQARPSLMVSVEQAVPGRTFDLAVRFVIDQGWHMYWPGQNDSGLPPSVTLKLPAGWKAGEPRWPAPERYVYDGEYVDHVYFSEVLVVIPVHVPESAMPGTSVIDAEVSWMVCKDLCEMGSKSLTHRLKVAASGSEPTPGSDAKAIEAALRAAPKPWPTDGSLRATVREGGRSLEIADRAGRALAFFPHADSVLVESVLKDCVGASGKPLSVALKKPNPGQKRIAGIVRVQTAADPLTYEHFWLERPLQPPAPAGGTTTKP